MIVDDQHCWWVVARSEELKSDRPIGITCAGHAIALWREPDGTARAVEDRCPHRRVPVSLGCILPDGRLRCGYHGWTFDGATGHLQEIPNLPGQKRFPPHYGVRTYSVHEEAGLVRVALKAEIPFTSAAAELLPLSGTVALTIDHAQYVRAFLDAPELVITVPGVELTKYLARDPQEQGGRLIMERSCRWRKLHWPARVSAEFELNLWTATDPTTGETEIKLFNLEFTPLLTARLAPVPAIRNGTIVRWRAQSCVRGLSGLRTRRQPILIHDHIEAAQLMAVLPSASIEFDKVRMGMRNAQVAAE